MATCLKFNQTIANSCRNSQPGVVDFWIANASDVTGFTYNAAGTQIIGITGSTASGATSGYFYKVSVNKESSGFVDTSEISIPDGRASFTPSVTIKIPSMDATTRTIYKSLSQATVKVIFKTVDGLYYLAGVDNGLDMTTGTWGTGTTKTDFKGLEITLTGYEDEPAVEIASSLIAAITVV